MSEFWPDGETIRVEVTENGTPQAFTWQGQRHEVAQIANAWRIDESWWATHIWRDYFKLLTRGGLLVEVYHDLTGDSWRLQRLYD